MQLQEGVKKSNVGKSNFQRWKNRKPTLEIFVSYVGNFHSLGLLLSGSCYIPFGMVPGPFRRLRKTLASTLPLPPEFGKITKKTSHGATRGRCTVQHAKVAPCNTTTSHRATPLSCTLRLLEVAPCHFRVSHHATQDASSGTPFKSQMPTHTSGKRYRLFKVFR